MICIHDSEIISYQVDFSKKTIDMKVETASLPCNSHEWIATISFFWVSSYEFLNLNNCKIIYEITKEDIDEYIKFNKKYLIENKNYLFMFIKWDWEEFLKELKKYLIKENIFIFNVSFVFWNPGVVFAKEMKIIWN